MVSEKPAKTVKPLNKREKNVISTLKPNSNWIQLFFTLAKCVSILCCLTIFHDGIFAHFQYHVSRIFFVYLFNVSNRRRVKNRKSFFIAWLFYWYFQQRYRRTTASMYRYTNTIDFLLDLLVVRFCFLLKTGIYLPVCSFNGNWR